MVFCQGGVLTEDLLPSNIKAEASGFTVSLDLPSYKLAEAEKIIIQKVLMLTRGNLKNAAEVLGISRGTLYSKIEKHKLTK